MRSPNRFRHRENSEVFLFVENGEDSGGAFFDWVYYDPYVEDPRHDSFMVGYEGIRTCLPSNYYLFSPVFRWSSRHEKP